MPIRGYKPTSPGRRFMTRSTFEEITTDKPYKPLVESKKRGSGRNSQGRMTVRHRGGGAKRNYRRIDFKRDKWDVPAKLATIEYDPNRSARIGLLHYADGEKRYILAPRGLQVGKVRCARHHLQIGHQSGRPANDDVERVAIAGLNQRLGMALKIVGEHPDRARRATA